MSTERPREATTPRASTNTASSEPSSFAKLLSGFARETDRGEATISAAMRGSVVHPATELLALQAGMHRYQMTIELASKLVDGASSAVKSVVGKGE